MKKIVPLFVILVFSCALTYNLNTYLVLSDTGTTIAVTGATADLSNPFIACTSQNQVFVLWQENIYSDNYGSDDIIYIQEVLPNGSLVVDKFVAINRSDVTEETIAFYDSNLVVDSQDNLHLFWYVMNYDNPQEGFIYYRKMNSNLETIIDNTEIFNYTMSGWGTSPFIDAVVEIKFDLQNNIHLLCCEYYYLLLDNNGNILDYYNFEPLDMNRPVSFELDEDLNVFFVSLDSYDYIYFFRLQYDTSSISLITHKLIDSDEEKMLLDPFLILTEGDLYVSYYSHKSVGPDIDILICKQIDLSGNVIDDAVIGFENPYTDFLSRNRSVVYRMRINQDSCAQQDAFFNYGVVTLDNFILLEERHILTIAKNDSYDHGPAVFSFRCEEAIDTSLWFSWLVNDGNNGFQIMIWNVDAYGNPITPVITVVPNNYFYQITPSEYITEFFARVEWEIFVTFTSIIALIAVRVILRKKRKLK